MLPKLDSLANEGGELAAIGLLIALPLFFMMFMMMGAMMMPRMNAYGYYPQFPGRSHFIEYVRDENGRIIQIVERWD